jgi:REP element-mobilizing transposase RayT
MTSSPLSNQSSQPLRVTEASLEAANRFWAPLRSRGELPHLYKPGGTYFVTFCLRDATPAGSHQPGRSPPRRPSVEKIRSLTIPEADAVAACSEPLPRAGACWLRLDGPAQIMAAALRHWDGQRYALHAWCVMPNHVHVVVTPAGSWRLSAILHSWKSYSAGAINQLLGRRGTLWERESFDHLIRSIESYRWFVEYVRQNPVKAGLCKEPEDWPYGSAYRPC